MANRIQPKSLTASELIIALNEVFPDSTYGAISMLDQYGALKAYLAYDDGTLAEVPNALDAYVSYLQHNTV